MKKLLLKFSLLILLAAVGCAPIHAIAHARYGADIVGLGDEEHASFWTLAKHVVPPAVTGTMDLVERNLTAKSGPDTVKPMRIALLRARATLDIFAMAYPAVNTTPKEEEADASNRRDKDIWELLRRDLDVGYEVVGAYQDLDHSQVDFCDADAKEKLNACLDWLEKLKANRKRYSYDEFVSRPANGTLYLHRHMSKFWWGNHGVIPLPRLSGMENMVRLLRDAQAVQALDVYSDVQRAQHVYLEPDHTQFHFFRKLVRSMLVLLDIFPDLLPPAPPGAEHGTSSTSPTGQQGSAASTSLPASGAGLEHQTLDSASGVLTASPSPSTSTAASDGSSSRRLLTRRTRPHELPSHELLAAPTGHGAMRSSSVGVGVGDRDTAAVEQMCDPHGAVANLRRLFKELGQVNNKVVAYEFYTGKGRRHKADKARRECDAAWKDLKAWMSEVHVPHLIRCLAASVVAH